MAKKKSGGGKRTPPPRFAPIHGSRFTQKDADRICPILLREHAMHGGLTADDLLARLKSKRHPLHRELTWDDTVAADRYRRTECGTMLRSFEIIYFRSDDSKKPVEHRTKLLYYIRQEHGDGGIGPDEDEDEEYFSTPQVRPKSSKRPAGRNCYTTTVEVMSTPAYQKQLIGRAKMELLSYQNRYAKMKELLNFSSEFGRLFASISKFCDRERERG